MASRRLEGKVALITGAARGIGAASARLFAHEGAALIITDIREDGLRELHGELRARDCAVVAMTGDLTDEQFAKALVSAAAEHFDKLDILYNNAGLMYTGSIDEVTPSILADAFIVNVAAQLITVKHAAALMRREKRGAILNTASMGGIVGFSGMIAYTTSKAAIVGATKSLAIELTRDNIRVNAIAPGIVDTPMPRKLLESYPEAERTKLSESFYARQLMKRFATPEEIAQTALFLCSDDASFITGVVLPVDGGWSCW
jgi:NAD(P)-dependent dehydrogenase (short-subunit alcohol dehydrogenase family)